MWWETVGLRTRPVWDQQNRSWYCTLRSWSWSCRSDVVLWDTILPRSSGRTQQLFKYCLWFLYSGLGTSLLWRSTVAFTYLKVNSAKCLCLLPVVLVLVVRILSCLHHWSGHINNLSQLEVSWLMALNIRYTIRHPYSPTVTVFTNIDAGLHIAHYIAVLYMCTVLNFNHGLYLRWQAIGVCVSFLQ